MTMTPPRVSAQLSSLDRLVNVSNFNLRLLTADEMNQLREIRQHLGEVGGDLEKLTDDELLVYELLLSKIAR